MTTDERIQRATTFFRQSVFEVMEKMYFVFLEPSSGEAPEEKMYTVEITFSGKEAGRILVGFTPRLLNTMIGNVLGLEEKDVKDQIREDTAKECVNMITGNFLQKFEPKHALFLSLPQFVGLQYLKRKEGHISLNMEGDGGYMWAELWFKAFNGK